MRKLALVINLTLLVISQTLGQIGSLQALNCQNGDTTTILRAV
jgi:hypothetical protein